MSRPAGRKGAPSTRRGRAIAEALLAVTGLVALASALSPWWYTRTTTGATSSVAEFYPGASFYAGGGGGGGTTTYAAYGLVRVGALYEGVLAVSLLLLALAWASVGAIVLSGRRPEASGLWLRRARRLTVLGVLLALAFLLVVPIGQPVLYRADDPGGSCSSGAGPCASFWGASTGASSIAWGAGAGWWLDLGVTALFALGVVVERARQQASGRPGPAPNIGSD